MLLRGEVAARKIAQEAAEKALSEEKVCDASEKIAAVPQEATAEQEARIVRAAEEILAARHAEKIAAEEDHATHRTEEAAAEQARREAAEQAAWRLLQSRPTASTPW